MWFRVVLVGGGFLFTCFFCVGWGGGGRGGRRKGEELSQEHTPVNIVSSPEPEQTLGVSRILPSLDILTSHLQV